MLAGLKIEITKERLIAIIAVTTAMIVWGLYFFLYGPLAGKLRIAAAECAVIEADLAQARNNIAILKTRDVKKGIINEEDISLAIDELTRQSKLGNINLISMTPGEIEESKDFSYKILPIEIEIKSIYSNLGVFLGSLRELKKSLVTVRNFNITLDRKGPEELKSRLLVDMYIAGGKNAE